MAPEPEAEPLDLAEVETSLRTRLAEVRDRLAVLKEPPESGSGIGFGKRIGDGTTEAIGRFTDVGVADSLEAIEAQLERALAKLAEGSYGACDSCGAEIAAGRLRIRPESTVCVDCAAR
ncbi:MAG: TraR/DksA C4-type zinc finger protein [Solirubrobacterales bacterium]